MEDPCNPKESPAVTNDNLLLKTQQALLAEMKRQNDLLEEQLRPQRAAAARKEAEKLALRKERERRIFHYEMIEQLAPIVTKYKQKCVEISYILNQPPPTPPLTYGGSMDWSASDKQAIYDHQKKQANVPKLLKEEEVEAQKKIDSVLSNYPNGVAEHYKNYLTSHGSLNIPKGDKDSLIRLLQNDAPRTMWER